MKAPSTRTKVMISHNSCAVLILLTSMTVTLALRLSQSPSSEMPFEMLREDQDVFAFVGARTLIKGSLGAPVLVQAYTVTEEHLKTSGLGAGSWVGTFLSNMHVAHQLGYNYVLFSEGGGGMRQRNACQFKGEQVSSHWCKLRALESAMQLHSESVFFMWLDGDAMLRNTQTKLPDFLTSSAICDLSPEIPLIYAWSNGVKPRGWERSACHTACNGVLVFRRGNDLQELLDTWWAYGAEDRKKKVPHDQQLSII